MKKHLRFAALSLSALAMGAAPASAGYVAARSPEKSATEARVPVITVADEPEIKVPETKLGAGALSTEAPMVGSESMEKMGEPEIKVPETKLGAGALSTEAPMVGSGSMEKAEELEVKVPETKLGAGALSTEAPMVDTGKKADDMSKSDDMGKSDDMSKDGAMMDGMKHTVMRGDNYWNLAKKYYGDATMWSKIAEANPGISAKDLTIGAELVIPK